MLFALLGACKRPSSQQSLDAGVVARDSSSPVDLIAPALLQGARDGLPDVPAALDTGSAERMTTSARGDTARVQGAHFRLEVAATREGTSERGRVSYTLRGADGFTVNAGYPITIEASATALELEKTSLRRADATSYTPQLARFVVNFNGGTAGETVVTELLFSVCRGAECEFESRRVVVVVP